jgi:DNA-binding CsgD family transcriptional regulator
MSSSQDISDLRQAQNNVAIQQRDFEQARLAVQNVERAQPTGDLLDLNTLEDATFGAFLDTLFLAVFLIGSDLRIVHANTAGRTMLSNGDPVRSAGGLLTLQSQASTIALIAAVAQAGNNEPATGPWNRQSIPAPTSTGTPHVLHVVPLRPSLLRLGPLASAVAAVFITSAPGTTLFSIDALAAQFDLTRTEARVFSKIAMGMTLRQVACSLNIEASTAKTHLLRIFSKTGTNRQVDLVRLAVSLALPI